jgi:hypothetical protein
MIIQVFTPLIKGCIWTLLFFIPLAQAVLIALCLARVRARRVPKQNCVPPAEVRSTMTTKKTDKQQKTESKRLRERSKKRPPRRPRIKNINSEMKR